MISDIPKPGGIPSAMELRDPNFMKKILPHLEQSNLANIKRLEGRNAYLYKGLDNAFDMPRSVLSAQFNTAKDSIPRVKIRIEAIVLRRKDLLEKIQKAHDKGDSAAAVHFNIQRMAEQDSLTKLQNALTQHEKTLAKLEPLVRKRNLIALKNVGFDPSTGKLF